MSTRGVVVAHHERMVAQGIGAALARYPAIAVLGTTSDPREAGELGARADAVALDLLLPGAHRVAQALVRRGVRVVLLGEGQDEGIQISTRASVAALASALVPGVMPPDEGRSLRSLLTSREREVLGLIAQGMTGRQVARHLGISPKTVESHKTRVFAKLGVSSQAAAVSRLLENASAASP